MKRYVQMLGKASGRVHIANSQSTTHCKFENGTRRKLIGFMNPPPGSKICQNCLDLQAHGEAPNLAAQLDSEYRAIVGAPIAFQPAHDFSRPPWE